MGGFISGSSILFHWSTFSFLILLIWILSLCLLVSLAKGLSILLIFFKEPAFGLVDSLYGSLRFYLIDFSPEFDDLLSSTPLEQYYRAIMLKTAWY